MVSNDKSYTSGSTAFPAPAATIEYKKTSLWLLTGDMVLATARALLQLQPLGLQIRKTPRSGAGGSLSVHLLQQSQNRLKIVQDKTGGEYMAEVASMYDDRCHIPV